MTPYEVYSRLDFTPTSGQGCYLFDQKKRPYLDLYGGHAVISIGHGHPHFVASITSQLEQLAFYSNSVQIPLQEKLANKLGIVSGLLDYQLFLCNSGAEAMENALKLASFQTGRKKVIAFKRCFHGRTSAAVNITDKESIKAPINRSFPVEFHLLNELETVKASLHKEDVCAVVLEGIQGWGGIYCPEPDFLENLQGLCQQTGTMLILDEVQSGYGRSGKFFAFQYANIQPDLVTVAKGMGNGFPIAGVFVHPSFEAKAGQLGTTFGGNHLACAAGVAVLEVLEKEKLLSNALEMGDYLKSQIKNFPGVVEVRGKGLMIGIEFGFPISYLRGQLFQEANILTGTALNPNTLRLLPPLCVGKTELDYFMDHLKLQLNQILSKKSLAKTL